MAWKLYGKRKKQKVGKKSKQNLQYWSILETVLRYGDETWV